MLLLLLFIILLWLLLLIVVIIVMGDGHQLGLYIPKNEANWPTSSSSPLTAPLLLLLLSSINLRRRRIVLLLLAHCCRCCCCHPFKLLWELIGLDKTGLHVHWGMMTATFLAKDGLLQRLRRLLPHIVCPPLDERPLIYDL